MNEGPFGFPRLTSVGPFVESKDAPSPEDFDLTAEEGMQPGERAEDPAGPMPGASGWVERFWPSYTSSQTERQVTSTILNGEVEALTDDSNIEPLILADLRGLTPYEKELLQAYAARQAVDKINAGEAMVVHNTLPDRAESIMANGFVGGMAPRRDDVVVTSIREDVIFSWIYINDASTFTSSGEEPREASIISKVNIRATYIAETEPLFILQSGLISSDEYEQYAVQRYDKFIRNAIDIHEEETLGIRNPLLILPVKVQDGTLMNGDITDTWIDTAEDDVSMHDDSSIERVRSKVGE